MSNANRDYAIVYDVKNSSLALSRPLVFYITDKNTSNIFVRLVSRISIGDGIDQYTDIENATSYVLTMRVIKPNNEVKSIEATQHEPKSIFQFDLTEDFKDIPGKYICELIISTIVSERQELITSDPFNYEVKRSILSNVSEIIETEDTTVEKLLNNLDATEAELSSQIAVERARINNLTTLAEGSTTGDAELIDARIGANGKAYENLGTANREQFSNANDVLNSHQELLSNLESLSGYSEREDKLTGLSMTTGFFNPTNSTYSTNESYSYVVLTNIHKGDKFRIKGKACWSGRGYAIIDSASNVISYYPTESNDINYDVTVEIPTNNCKVILNIYNASLLDYKLEKIVYRYDNINSELLDIRESLSNLQNLSTSTEYVDILTGLEKITGFFNPTNGKYSSNESYSYVVLANLYKGCKLRIKGKSCWNGHGYAIIDNTGNVVSYYPTENNDIDYDVTVEIPSNNYKVILNINNASLSNYKLEKMVYKYEKEGNRLNGVKWCAFGDSLTDSKTLSGQSTGTKNYVDYISSSLGLTVTNCGVGGTGYKKESYSGDANTFVDRVSTIPTDTDILTVFGSFNDFEFISSSLGQLGDTTTDTLYGAMNKFLVDVFTRCPDIVIGIIIPTPWNYESQWNSDTNAITLTEKYIKALKDTAYKWSLPVLDLYSESGLRPWDSTFVSKYFREASGVHPLDPAHKKYISPKIEAFISQIYKKY